MEGNAAIDPTGKYRYSLTRVWDTGKGKVTFIMLNPSTADEKIDDAATTKCIRFAQLWGYGSLEIVNVFAFRSRYPENLINVADPIGPENDYYIRRAIENSDIVLAWGDGSRRICEYRTQQVIKLISNHNLHCIKLTKKKCPMHPLYLSYKSELTKVRWIDSEFIV